MKDSLPNMDEVVASLKQFASTFDDLVIPRQILLLIEEREQFKITNAELKKTIDEVQNDLISFKYKADEEREQLQYRDRVVSRANETLGRYVNEGKEEIRALKAKVAEQDKEIQRITEQKLEAYRNLNDWQQRVYELEEQIKSSNL